METPKERAARLLSALEDLVMQESATLKTRNFAEAIAIQERAAPLVQSIASNANRLSHDLRLRVAALIERRRANDAWLAGEIEVVRVRLQDTAETQRRVTQLSPTYGRSVATCQRLSARG